MKNLVNYIKESLSKEDAIIKMLLTADSVSKIKEMLSEFDNNDLKRISSSLEQSYKDKYFVYKPSNDLLIKEKDKYISQIAEFINSIK